MASPSVTPHSSSGGEFCFRAMADNFQWLRARLNIAAAPKMLSSQQGSVAKWRVEGEINSPFLLRTESRGVARGDDVTATAHASSQLGVEVKRRNGRNLENILLYWHLQYLHLFQAVSDKAANLVSKRTPGVYL